MNGRTIFIFILSLVLTFIVGVALFSLILPLLNSIFPAVTRDTFNREVHVMPVSNMLWSLAISVSVGVFVLTFLFKKLKKTYGK